jgi:hypothetical protein
MNRLQPSAAYKKEQRRQLIWQALAVAVFTAVCIGAFIWRVYSVTSPENLPQ